MKKRHCLYLTLKAIEIHIKVSSAVVCSSPAQINSINIFLLSSMFWIKLLRCLGPICFLPWHITWALNRGLDELPAPVQSQERYLGRVLWYLSIQELTLGKVPEIWGLLHPENVFWSKWIKEASRSPLINAFWYVGWVPWGGVSQALLSPLKMGVRADGAPVKLHTAPLSLTHRAVPLPIVSSSAPLRVSVAFNSSSCQFVVLPWLWRGWWVF